MRPSLLVFALDVAQHGSFLGEALLAELAAERSLPCVSAVVFVQSPLCAESFATQMALERPLSGVNQHVHGQVVLLSERMATFSANEWLVMSVKGFDVHLQAVSA